MKTTDITRIASLIITVLMLLSAVSCGSSSSVQNAYIDANGHLIVGLSDGSTQDMGIFLTEDPTETEAETSASVDVKSVTVDENLHAIVEYSDGTKNDLGYVGVTDESKNVTVKKVSVNSEMHAIAELSDGTSQDLGYVGVEVIKEVEPPLYTVKFVDINGKELSVQEVYRGKSAKAPEAPAVADATFKCWDYDYTNIQGDVTIKPEYTAAAQYTVQFLSADGAVLKTETVISGHAATAPSAPSVSGKVFSGWDKSFSKVTSDLIVTATYRDPGSYTVTFKDYTGVVLGTASVAEGAAAVAPVTPARDGYTFTGWSPAVTNVKSNITAVAQYKFKGGTNVLDIAASVSGTTLKITVSVKGSVKLCGLEGNLATPAGLTCKSCTAGTGDTTVNLKDGKIYFMFSSGTGKNVTKETVLFTATYTIGSASSADFAFTVDDIYDQDFAKVSYSVAGKSVSLK